ncbi:MAG: MFS transporter [Gammaproteobacteria bacterium]|nr:MFS transporter [Gammaproteobacteria bacterium]
MKSRTADYSPWVPLQYPVFRMLWFATLVSNIGTFMNDVGAAWLMTSLSSDPFIVALVQVTTASSLFLLALPAGALADIVDRRRYLLVLQTIMMCIAGVLTFVTYFDLVTPQILLLLTFCLGATAALSAPSWQATIPELVPAKALMGAISLNSVSSGVSRSVGPAIAGVIIIYAGSAAVFAINTLSFLGIIISLLLWHRQREESTLPAERFASAVSTGIRYVYASPVLHNVLIRVAAFMFFASVIWALLPLVARVTLERSAAGYGSLFTLFGVGAVVGTVFSQRINAKFSSDQLIQIGFIIFAIGTLILSLTKDYYIACFAMILTGFSWMIVSSILITAAQQAIPSWIRGRALSIYLMVQYGSMAVGSMVWGLFATHFSISWALFIASIGLIVSTFATQIYSLEKIKNIDHTPSPSDLHAPISLEELDNEQGPIMVSVEYRISLDELPAFIKVMRKMRRIRLREGAFFWKLFKDAEIPGRYIEYFMSESWVEHLRLNEHVSVSDVKVQERAALFHLGKKPPRVTYFAACDVSKKRPSRWTF